MRNKNRMGAGVAILLSTLSLSPVTRGQNTPVPPTQPTFNQRLNQIVARVTDATKEPEKVFSWKFEGGPVELFVTEIKKIVEPSPNIIIAPGLEELPVPAFDFQNVTLSELLNALNALAVDGKGGFWQQANSEKIWVFNPQSSGRGQMGYGPYGQPGMPPMASGQGSASQTCRVFPVGQYLNEYKIEDITTAVQTAWGMMGDTNAVVKYHKDTELLLVLGSPEQLRIVMDVLSSLEKSRTAKLARPMSGQAGAAQTQQTEKRAVEK